MMTRREALILGMDRLRGHVESPALDAQVLLCEADGCDRIDLLVRGEALLLPERERLFLEWIEKRLEACPVAYLIHKKEFMGLAFYVDERVLIPRPDTEILVEAVMARAKRDARILDLGTGSGAIAVSLAYAMPEAAVWAGDVSSEALEVACRNNALCGNRVDLRQGDLFAPFTGMTFDVVVSNPPYIRAADHAGLMADVRDHEPLLALVADQDGLAFYERITAQAHAFLSKGGLLAFEVGHDQAEAVRRLMELANFDSIEIIRDLAGIERVVTGLMR